jgi:hypothetical protein
MNRKLICTTALCLAFPLAGMAQSTTQTASLPSLIPGQDLHNFIKSAHSAAQYQLLADYFHQQEAKYRAEAAAEKIERDRRAQVNAGVYQKYPRPVDSAQYLYESYSSSADQAGLQAQHYELLATGQPQHSEQAATTPQGNK